MKRYLLFLFCLLTAVGSFAQKDNMLDFKFYGQVRADLFYNSRANEETVDGLFYMYPKDERLDAEGNDLNATANSKFCIPVWDWMLRDLCWAEQELRRKWKWISEVRALLFPPFASVMHISTWTGELQNFW